MIYDSDVMQKVQPQALFWKASGRSSAAFQMLSSYQAISSVKLAKIGQEVCEKLWPSPALVRQS